MRGVIPLLCLLLGASSQSPCDRCTDGICEVNEATGEAECRFACLTTDALWSNDKKAWCCKTHRICEYNCETDEERTAQKDAWCCSVMNDCRYNCMTRELWSSDKSKWCCEVRGMGCPLSCDPSVPSTCGAGMACQPLHPHNDQQWTCVPTCSVHADCDEKEFCRAGVGTNGCTSDVSVCTERVGYNGQCGGHVPNCWETRCEEGMTCEGVQQQFDGPGVCVRQTILEGEICETKDFVSNNWGFSLKERCAVGLRCLPIPDGDWTCQKPLGECETNTDCPNTHHCRQAVDSNGECNYDNQKVCVPYAAIGQNCGGFTMVCYMEACHPDHECAYNEMVADAPGTCVKKVMGEGDVCKTTVGFDSFDRSASCAPPLECVMERVGYWTCQKPLEECETNTDCPNTHHCRQAVDSNGECNYDNQKVCVPYAAIGQNCGGYTMVCYMEACHPDHECAYNEMVADAPGTCVKKVMGEGDVCKTTDGFDSFDRSASCAPPLECVMERVGYWTCQYSTKCTSDRKSAVLCSPSGQCPPGTECSGCMPCTDESSCQPVCIDVPTTNCVFARMLTEAQMEECCSTEKVYCKPQSDAFRCTTDTRTWGFEQRRWCCDQRDIACPVPEVDCTTTSHLLTEGVVVDEFVHIENIEVCCERYNIGCPVDCFDEQVLPWSVSKQQTCCSVENINCPPKVSNELYQRCKLSQLEGTFDAEMRQRCCNEADVGCPAERFDCFTPTLGQWSAEHQTWCCMEYDISCPLDCSQLSLSMMESNFCCSLKGLHCPQSSSYSPSQFDLRLSFRTAFSKVQSNPKRFHRKLRQTLIRSSPVLVRDPSLLTIKFIGWLMSNGQPPPTKNLLEHGITIRPSWTDELLAEELVTELNTRQGSVLSDPSPIQSDTSSRMMLFVDFEVKSDVAIRHLKEVAAEGSFSNNGDGYALILDTVRIQENVTAIIKPTPTSHKEDDLPCWLIALVSGTTIGLVLVVVGALFLRKKLMNKTDVTTEPPLPLQPEELEKPGLDNPEYL